MVVDYEAIKKLAKEYADTVRQALPVDKVFLYGSYAKGMATNLSDVDICFFINDFGSKRRVDIIGELLGLCGRYKGAYFEPNAFPTSEIGRGNPFVEEIVMTGIEI
ncbi:MAG: nucleotidyltransferase domain-containing protein [Defluviitaleaceae bacterium]|nr:nucleotidyltransferase domain-containing protein [Defluviitaleaceae bacterium]